MCAAFQLGSAGGISGEVHTGWRRSGHGDAGDGLAEETRFSGRPRTVLRSRAGKYVMDLATGGSRTCVGDFALWTRRKRRPNLRKTDHSCSGRRRAGPSFGRFKPLGVHETATKGLRTA